VVAEPLHERVCAELGPVSEEIVAQLGGLDVEGKQEPRSLGGDSSIAMEDSVDTVIRILNTCSGVCQGKARIWYHCVVCSCDQREPSRGNRLLSTLMTGRMMTKVTKRSTPGLQSMCAAGSSSLSSAHGGVYPPDF